MGLFYFDKCLSGNCRPIHISCCSSNTPVRGNSLDILDTKFRPGKFYYSCLKKNLMFVKDLFGYGILTSVYAFGVDSCGAIYVIQ